MQSDIVLTLLGAALVVVLFLIFRVLRQVHSLVNSRLSEALNDITALKKALVDERRQTERGR